jgi:hypothetical protein
MSTAPAHLEAKLRFGDLTVGQLVSVLIGVLVGFTWAQYVCPMHGLPAAISGAYLGGLPIAVVYVASQTEFDLWTLMIAAVRWRRTEGRFLPGPGGSPCGYVLIDDSPEQYPDGRQLERLDAAALWGEP